MVDRLSRSATHYDRDVISRFATKTYTLLRRLQSLSSWCPKDSRRHLRSSVWRIDEANSGPRTGLALRLSCLEGRKGPSVQLSILQTVSCRRPLCQPIWWDCGIPGSIESERKKERWFSAQKRITEWFITVISSIMILTPDPRAIYRDHETVVISTEDKQ